MPGFLLTTMRPVSTERPGTLLRLPGMLCQAIARYFNRRTAIADLGEFDECALRDISIARSQIKAAVLRVAMRRRAPEAPEADIGDTSKTGVGLSCGMLRAGSGSDPFRKPDHRFGAPPAPSFHQRRKRGRMSAPSAATSAVAIVYQVARKGAVSSGQCRL